jgi:manganese-dependent ADP-ribose/CDP-alcohol diphosphatase
VLEALWQVPPSLSVCPNLHVALLPRLGIPSNHAPGSSYYSVTPHPGWKIVMLDAYDVSALGREASHPHSQMAAALLAERNPNHVRRRSYIFSGCLQKLKRDWGD